MRFDVHVHMELDHTWAIDANSPFEAQEEAMSQLTEKIAQKLLTTITVEEGVT